MSLVEKLIELIKPHEELIRKSEGWLGMAQLIAPALVLLNVKRAGSTNGLPVVPFLFMSILTSLNALHSQARNDEAQLKAHLTAFSCSVVYLTTYFYYVPSKEKSLILKIILVGAGFVGSLWFYKEYQSLPLPPQRIELVIRSVLYSYYLLGFVGVIKAFQDQCTRHMPFEMIFAGAIMTINKAAGSLLKNDRFFIIQFSIFLFVHTLQLLCFLFFPNQLKSQKSSKSAKSSEKSTKPQKDKANEAKKNKKSKKE